MITFSHSQNRSVSPHPRGSTIHPQTKQCVHLLDVSTRNWVCICVCMCICTEHKYTRFFVSVFACGLRMFWSHFAQPQYHNNNTMHAARKERASGQSTRKCMRKLWDDMRLGVDRRRKRGGSGARRTTCAPSDRESGAHVRSSVCIVNNTHFIKCECVCVMRAYVVCAHMWCWINVCQQKHLLILPASLSVWCGVYDVSTRVSTRWGVRNGFYVERELYKHSVRHFCNIIYTERLVHIHLYISVVICRWGAIYLQYTHTVWFTSYNTQIPHQNNI